MIRCVTKPFTIVYQTFYRLKLHWFFNRCPFIGVIDLLSAYFVAAIVFSQAWWGSPPEWPIIRNSLSLISLGHTLRVLSSVLGPTSNNLERNVSLVTREGWHWTEIKIKRLLYCIGISKYAYHKRFIYIYEVRIHILRYTHSWKLSTDFNTSVYWWEQSMT